MNEILRKKSGKFIDEILGMDDFFSICCPTSELIAAVQELVKLKAA